jgi:alanine-glyoxylate transaminase/serine-glyoxylate transaminase/serine-pyruvate transaminase
MTMIRRYWASERLYHHTAPVNMTYALREALRAVLEEGLHERFKRHELNHRALRAGLEAMGLRYIPEHPLPTLNAVSIPTGVRDSRVRQRLLEEYGIEIGGGLGPFKGKAWRIGLMGTSSTRRNVTLVLEALESIITQEGVKVPRGEALAATNAIYTQ